MRKVLVDEAVGMELGYDITKIVPGKEKYRAFRRGHVIKPEDVSRLKDMGKQYVYVWLPGDNMIHEDEAALRIARAAAGPGIAYTEPSQGRVNLKACHAGLLKVQTAQLNWLNNLENVVFATLHSNRVVAKDQKSSFYRLFHFRLITTILNTLSKCYIVNQATKKYRALPVHNPATKIIDRVFPFLY
jgi:hypothetical protein